jgi:hypothetical protein
VVEFDDDMLWVTPKDGRVIGTPLEWYPRLASATVEQRQHVELYPFGVYWPDLDDGVDIQAMVTGHWTIPVDAVAEQAAP